MKDVEYYNKIIDDCEDMIITVLENALTADESLKYGVAATIAYEILDLKLSINALLENSCYAGIRSLTRTMLENYIYLVYILQEDSVRRSEAYLLSIYKEMSIVAQKQRENKTIQEMIKEDKSLNLTINFYEENHKEVEEYVKRYNEIYDHQLKKWYSDDNKTNSIYSLFKRLGKSYVYDTAYRYLCLETHGNNGFKHLTLVDEEYAKFQRTTVNIDEIEGITSNILIEVKNELNKLTN
ncbi:DUF5677 domain-containing protein [Enterococcus faecalis]|uniref:DUF5677 domain-containing protein n=1 Tax=Enterococcus faecalis TaxID=1351 RepID=UPI0019DDC722|nr:hypothetical protein [Enterococcus faecalis]EGO8522895.1 hypothetical protein [Enterococcus faecalis]EGO9006581.1 hypothetical protein [Enterococcus faecalis]EHV2898184.1 hypothetical protein [Enterococcus faecalis]EIT5121996.1 hypothetical protein [Enterococcus faecalis]